MISNDDLLDYVEDKLPPSKKREITMQILITPYYGEIVNGLIKMKKSFKDDVPFRNHLQRKEQVFMNKMFPKSVEEL